MIKIMNAAEAGAIINRERIDYSAVEKTVATILAKVREEGDKALYEYTERFDKVKLNALLVTEEEISEAYNNADRYFIETLKQAGKNIAVFHKKQLRKNYAIKKKDGTIVGQRFLPLDSVGLYIPGGTAGYPSTVLMNAVPAKLAGVRELAIVTPPGKDGKVNPDVLTAARIAGVDRIYKVGGAQAIAALAYGTQTIKKVDKIVGPGNMYVAAAKKQVFGEVGIDMIAGPSEILIISDGKSDPGCLAADLLSQAEHDKNASAILITDSSALAEKVSAELEKQLSVLPRESVARASIDDHGRILLVSRLEEAAEVSNSIAPEHLELCVDEPFALLDKITSAGSVFLGRSTPEATGDYFAGANHTLPTSGTARFSSPLSVDDFIKKSQYIFYTAAALKKNGRRIADFAEREGLQAHARSITARTKD
jgi:histidinol dehydrogenase